MLCEDFDVWNTMSPSFNSTVGVAKDPLHPDSKQGAINIRKRVILEIEKSATNAVNLEQQSETTILKLVWEKLGPTNT